MRRFAFYSHVENTYNDRTISLKVVVWVKKTSLAPPLFIEAPIYQARKVSGRVC